MIFATSLLSTMRLIVERIVRVTRKSFDQFGSSESPFIDRRLGIGHPVEHVERSIHHSIRVEYISVADQRAQTRVHTDQRARPSTQLRSLQLDINKTENEGKV